MNNRQNGRRRGRGGVRPQGAPRPEGGSRIDNRARGNAAQLHEKYKNLARDAQMQGDRVLTEYYFQFADHYFRILAENRPRFEEGDRQQQRNGRDEGRWDNRDDMAEGSEGSEGYADERFTAPPRSERPDRAERQDRGDRPERGERAERSERVAQAPAGEAGPERTEAPVDAASDADPEAAPAPRRRRGRPRRDEAAPELAMEMEAPERIEADRLPPAVRAESEAPGAALEGEPRRRRTRRPRAEGAADASVAAEA